METVQVIESKPIEWEPHHEITNLRLQCIVCNKAEATEIVRLKRGDQGFNPHVCAVCAKLPGDEIFKRMLERN